MDLDLFTVHHKNDNNIQKMRKYFEPIQVGCAISKIDLGIRRDDDLGKISFKNPNYCELTAFDEIARASKARHVGVMHYRRIFTKPKPICETLAMLKYYRRLLKRRLGMRKRAAERHVMIKLKSQLALDTEAQNLISFLKENLANIDIITPFGVMYRHQTLREKYAEAHIVEHFDIFMESLIQVRPDIAAFVLNQDHEPATYYIGNMFIMRQEIFQDYWLILSEALKLVEDQINLEELDPYQRRVFGFLAERFMGIFCRYYTAKHRVVWKNLPIAICN